jgi:undecaprenyl diphosphate synthase
LSKKVDIKLSQVQKKLFAQIDLSRVPKHVAIIMDGNGRWAKKRGLPRIAGHRAGIESLRETINIAVKTGIKYLTVYAFSTENWNRPKPELTGLFSLFETVFANEVDDMVRNGVRIISMGHVEKFPKSVGDSILRAEEMSVHNDRLILIVAFNYGSREEITDAARGIAVQVLQGKIDVNEINADLFSRSLYIPGCPYPDLLIRTSGEVRISNFLLWQIAYCELYFTKTLWPDFDATTFLRALISYQSRKRRFGGLLEGE